MDQYDRIVDWLDQGLPSQEEMDQFLKLITFTSEELDKLLELKKKYITGQNDLL